MCGWQVWGSRLYLAIVQGEIKDARQSSALNSGSFHVTSNHNNGEFSQAFRTLIVTQVKPSWQKNCKRILVMSL
jgi:hypothetical protein